jgi:hypothetical protein
VDREEGTWVTGLWLYSLVALHEQADLIDGRDGVEGDVDSFGLTFGVEAPALPSRALKSQWPGVVGNTY